MATLYETCNERGWVTSSYGDVWRAQTFTIGTVGIDVSHILTVTNVKGYRIGLPGTLTISIRAVDGSGVPTGNDLSAGTYNGNSFYQYGPETWSYGIAMTGYLLKASTKYGMIVRALDGDASNYFSWVGDIGQPYAGGQTYASTNAGVDWTPLANEEFDASFAEWGVIVQGAVFMGANF